ncbi:hypothetical protein GGQ15_002597 [Salinibacter ruber]|jgi:hypothetical protein|nr:hypothetical protein [Salinibacter ruber]MCS4142201.1 hypothetical protein [Salinibacter ruber]
MITEKRSDELPLANCAGMTSGSEDDIQALRRVLPTIKGGQSHPCEGVLRVPVS